MSPRRPRADDQTVPIFHKYMPSETLAADFNGSVTIEPRGSFRAPNSHLRSQWSGRSHHSKMASYVVGTGRLIGGCMRYANGSPGSLPEWSARLVNDD